jgi:hypothetical protein
MRVKVNRQIYTISELSSPLKIFTQNGSIPLKINHEIAVINNGGCSSGTEDGFSISKNEANRLLYLQIMQNRLNKSTLTRKTEHALSRLEEFETLEQNWDSYDAPPIHWGSIEEAREVLKIIAIDNILKNVNDFEFYPIPTPSGGVTLYFELKSKELRVKLNPNPDERVIIRVDKINPERYNYEQSDYHQSVMMNNFRWLNQDDSLSNGENKWNIFPIETTYTSECAVFILINSKTSRMKHLSHANLSEKVIKTTVEGNPWNGVDIALLQKSLKKRQLLNVSSAAQ